MYLFLHKTCCGPLCWEDTRYVSIQNSEKLFRTCFQIINLSRHLGSGCSRLTKLLVNVYVKILNVIIWNMPTFFVVKMWEVFALQKLLVFQQNMSVYFGYKFVKHLMSWPLNKLVILTIWPWLQCIINPLERLSINLKTSDMYIFPVKLCEMLFPSTTHDIWLMMCVINKNLVAFNTAKYHIRDPIFSFSWANTSFLFVDIYFFVVLCIHFYTVTFYL